MANRLDGNALAGPLSDVFALDMTTASGCCQGCGDIRVLAEAVVYDAAPGWAVRCRECGGVLMVIVRSGNRVRLDTRGLSSLQMGLPE